MKALYKVPHVTVTLRKKVWKTLSKNISPCELSQGVSSERAVEVKLLRGLWLSVLTASRVYVLSAPLGLRGVAEVLPPLQAIYRVV